MLLLLGLLVGFAAFGRNGADILVLPYDGRFIEEEFRDMPSLFGNGLPYEGLHGMIINAQPLQGCTPLKKPPPLDENRTGKWIALIARYNCSFETKVRMAQENGYDAVIVHNVKSDNLEPMSAKNSSGIHIPSVFVSESAGMILREVYADNALYFVIINSEVPFNINTHLLLPFAIVVGICFLIMVVFMICKFVNDRREQRRDRLSSSSLNKMPVCKFQRGDPYETCAICLEDYVEGEKLRVLPCAHAYHMKCIDPWLTKNKRVCPCCKRKVFARGEAGHPDSSDSESETDTATTPLLRGNNRHNNGTFREVIDDWLTQRIRQATLVASTDQHSINGEQLIDDDDDENAFHEVQTSMSSSPPSSTSSSD